MPMDASAVGAVGWRDARFGLVFVVLFLLAGVTLGNVFGSFGDPDEWFIERYVGAGTRARDIVGGALLTVAALTLLPFLNRLPPGDQRARRDSVADAGLLGITMLLSGAAALVAVPLSISFGALFGDAALTSPAVALAPQLGVVFINFSAAWILAIVIIAQTRRARGAGQAPRWLVWLSYACALILATSAFSGLALVGLPVWVGAVSLHLYRRGAATATGLLPNGLVGSRVPVEMESG
jgi:hypothetical protein